MQLGSRFFCFFLNENICILGSLGASTNPCSHNYAGIAPFSEPETRAIAEFMKDELEGKLHIFLDFHSYSQKWLAPWGYTSKLPENYLQQVKLYIDNFIVYLILNQT